MRNLKPRWLSKANPMDQKVQTLENREECPVEIEKKELDALVLLKKDNEQNILEWSVMSARLMGIHDACVLCKPLGKREIEVLGLWHRCVHEEALRGMDISNC